MPPLDLPPQPPAIHAPVPAQQVQASTSMNSAPSQVIRTASLGMLGRPYGRVKENRGRWWHVKRWHGKRSASIKARGNKRKAARKKKR